MAPSLLHLGTALLALSGGSHAVKWKLQETHNATNFLKYYDFYTKLDDGNNGVNLYVNGSDALKHGLYETRLNDQVYLGLYHKSVLEAGQKRKSIRVQSKNTYKNKLIIGRFTHLPPSTCGLWPAFWTWHQPWLQGGEVDIFERWNLDYRNSPVFHVSQDNLREDKYKGCRMEDSDQRAVLDRSNLGGTCQDGGWPWGCKAIDPNVIDPKLGGVFAMEWTSDFIRLYSWQMTEDDRLDHSSLIDTDSWGVPMAQLLKRNCDIDNHFQPQTITINLALCGTGVNSQWQRPEDMCPSLTGKMSCEEFVASTPEAFTEAYFEIQDIRIFSKAPPEESSLPSTTSATYKTSMTTSTSEMTSTSVGTTSATPSNPLSSPPLKPSSESRPHKKEEKDESTTPAIVIPGSAFRMDDSASTHSPRPSFKPSDKVESGLAGASAPTKSHEVLPRSAISGPASKGGLIDTIPSAGTGSDPVSSNAPSMVLPSALRLQDPSLDALKNSLQKIPMASQTESGTMSRGSSPTPAPDASHIEDPDFARKLQSVSVDADKTPTLSGMKTESSGLAGDKTSEDPSEESECDADPSASQSISQSARKSPVPSAISPKASGSSGKGYTQKEPTAQDGHKYPSEPATPAHLVPFEVTRTLADGKPTTQLVVPVSMEASAVSVSGSLAPFPVTRTLPDGRVTTQFVRPVSPLQTEGPKPFSRPDPDPSGDVAADRKALPEPETTPYTTLVRTLANGQLTTEVVLAAPKNAPSAAAAAVTSDNGEPTTLTRVKTTTITIPACPSGVSPCSQFSVIPTQIVELELLPAQKPGVPGRPIIAPQHRSLEALPGENRQAQQADPLVTNVERPTNVYQTRFISCPASATGCTVGQLTVETVATAVQVVETLFPALPAVKGQRHHPPGADGAVPSHNKPSEVDGSTTNKDGNPLSAKGPSSSKADGSLTETNAHHKPDTLARPADTRPGAQSDQKAPTVEIVHTVTACPPVVTNCPHHSVFTETVTLAGPINTGSGPAVPALPTDQSQRPNQPAANGVPEPQRTVTICECPPAVTPCPQDKMVTKMFLAPALPTELQVAPVPPAKGDVPAPAQAVEKPKVQKTPETPKQNSPEDLPQKPAENRPGKPDEQSPQPQSPKQQNPPVAPPQRPSETQPKTHPESYPETHPETLPETPNPHKKVHVDHPPEHNPPPASPIEQPAKNAEKPVTPNVPASSPSPHEIAPVAKAPQAPAEVGKRPMPEKNPSPFASPKQSQPVVSPPEFPKDTPTDDKTVHLQSNPANPGPGGASEQPKGNPPKEPGTQTQWKVASPVITAGGVKQGVSALLLCVMMGLLI